MPRTAALQGARATCRKVLEERGHTAGERRHKVSDMQWWHIKIKWRRKRRRREGKSREEVRASWEDPSLGL